MSTSVFSILQWFIKVYLQLLSHRLKYECELSHFCWNTTYQPYNDCQKKQICHAIKNLKQIKGFCNLKKKFKCKLCKKSKGFKMQRSASISWKQSTSRKPSGYGNFFIPVVVIQSQGKESQVFLSQVQRFSLILGLWVDPAVCGQCCFVSRVWGWPGSREWEKTSKHTTPSARKTPTLAVYVPRWTKPARTGQQGGSEGRADLLAGARTGRNCYIRNRKFRAKGNIIKDFWKFEFEVFWESSFKNYIMLLTSTSHLGSPSAPTRSHSSRTWHPKFFTWVWGRGQLGIQGPSGGWTMTGWYRKAIQTVNSPAFSVAGWRHGCTGQISCACNSNLHSVCASMTVCTTQIMSQCKQNYQSNTLHSFLFLAKGSYTRAAGSKHHLQRSECFFFIHAGTLLTEKTKNALFSPSCFDRGQS